METDAAEKLEWKIVYDNRGKHGDAKELGGVTLRARLNNGSYLYRHVPPDVNQAQVMIHVPKGKSSERAFS